MGSSGAGQQLHYMVPPNARPGLSSSVALLKGTCSNLTAAQTPQAPPEASHIKLRLEVLCVTEGVGSGLPLLIPHRQPGPEQARTAAEGPIHTWPARPTR